MKRIFLILLSAFAHGNLTASEPTSIDIQKEAIDIVAAISENLADLIIHHKKTTDPEITKQHSVELVKNIAQAIALCIKNAKNKQATRQISCYDQETIDATIEHIANNITKLIQTDGEENI